MFYSLFLIFNNMLQKHQISCGLFFSSAAKIVSTKISMGSCCHYGKIINYVVVFTLS